MRKYALLVLGILIAIPLFINPNPFGNNTLMVGDEAYFLSSAVSAIAHHTLPGWDFSIGGAYYGGVLTYLVTVAAFFYLGFVFIVFHSFNAAQGFISANYGDLLHVVRLVNGVSVLACLASLVLFLKRRDHWRVFGSLGVLIAAAAFGNPLFVLAFHTGKVWTISALCLLIAGTFVIFQEFSLQHRHEPLIAKRTYTAWLLWLSFLSFLQSPTTIHVIFWLFLAWFLGHTDLTEIWAVVKKQWIFVLLVASTQVSFIVRVVQLTLGVATPESLNGTTFLLPNGSPDLVKKYVWPFQALLESHPLLLVALVGLFVFACFMAIRAKEAKTREKSLIILLFSLIYPAIIYLADFQFAGFSRAPRYVIMFSLGCAMVMSLLSTLLTDKARWRLAVPFVLVALVVLTKVMFLFWAPSSEQSVYAFFRDQHNTTSTFIIIESNRVELPLNQTSFAYNGEKITALRRNALLMEHSDLLERFVSFKPVVTYSSSRTFDASGQPLVPPGILQTWTVSDCEKPCSVDEKANGSCIAYNEAQCRVEYGSPQTVSTLSDLFLSDQIGNAYFIRQTKP